MRDGYIPLVTNQTWDSDSDTPVKFSVGYVYARDLNNGRVTYNIAVDIEPLPEDKYGTVFGYPIYAQVYMRNGLQANWTSVPWADNVYTWTIKNAQPYNWKTDLSCYTQNVQLDANPGDNVQLMVHLYSSDSLSSRDIVFLWGIGIPDDTTRTVSNKSNHISSTPLTVPDPAGASLSAVPTLTISSTAGQDLSFTCTNLIASYAYRLTATLNGAVIRMHDFVKGQSSGTITVPFGSEHIQAALNAMPTSASGNIQYALSTYSSTERTSQIGTTSYKSGVCVINTASIKPSISNVVYTRIVNGSEWRPPQTIQTVTKIHLTNFSYNAAYGSPASSYVAKIGSKTYPFSSSALPLDITVEDSGSLDFKIGAYDRRGAYGETTVTTLNVLSYDKPQIASYLSTRCNAQGDDDVEGKYFRADVATTIAPLHRLYIVAGVLPEDQTDAQHAYIRYDDTQYYSGSPNVREQWFRTPQNATLTLVVKHPATSSGQSSTITVAKDGGQTIVYYGAWNDGAEHTYNISFDRNWLVNITVNNTKSSIIIQEDDVSLSRQNTLAIRHKQTSDTIWQDDETFILRGSSTGFVAGNGEINTDASYDIQYTLKDFFTQQTPITIQDYLSSAEYTLFLAKGGKAVSIGEAYNPAVGSTEKVLNINSSWIIKRGGGGTGGGVVPPYVTEHIASDTATSGITWSYRKWDNGFVELWGKTGSITQTCSTLWGGMYSSDTPTTAYAYPVTFSSEPTVLVNLIPKGQLNAILFCRANNTLSATTETPQYQIMRGGDRNTQVTFALDFYIAGFEATS